MVEPESQAPRNESRRNDLPQNDLPQKNMQTKLHVAQVSFYFLYASLVLLLVSGNIFRSGGGPLWTILAIQLLPLLAFLPGIIKKHYRSYSWLCFVLLIYFIRAVEGVFMSNANAMDGVFLLLVVALFINSMLCSRWLQRSLHIQQA